MSTKPVVKRANGQWFVILHDHDLALGYKTWPEAFRAALNFADPLYMVFRTPKVGW